MHQFSKNIFSRESYITLWNNLTKAQIELIKNSLMSSLIPEK